MYLPEQYMRMPCGTGREQYFDPSQPHNRIEYIEQHMQRQNGMYVKIWMRRNHKYVINGRS